MAIVSFLLTTTVFAPAILLTSASFAGSIISAILGSLRLSALGFFFVAATFLLISQQFRGPAQIEWLVMGFVVVGVTLGVILYAQFRKQTSTT